MKYLVTGVAGFIGSRTVAMLLDQGHDVVGVDNLNTYYDIRLKSYRINQLMMQLNEDDSPVDYMHDSPIEYTGPNYIQAERFEFHQLDIENKEALELLFRKHNFDAVINLAARAGVRYSMIDPQVYMTTNAMGTLNLMDCMRDYKVKKLVLASTSSLYAGQAMPFDESLAVNTPISPYAASKKSAEVMAYSYHNLYDLDVSVVRYFTVFGPAGRPDMCIFRFIKWINEAKPIELFGDGSQSRDFTYVDDIAKGTIAALKNVGYEVINLGGGKAPVSLNTIIQWIEEMLNKKASIEYKPFHKADIKETWASIEKADRLLNWKPEVDLKDGVESCVRWAIQNEAFLNKISL